MEHAKASVAPTTNQHLSKRLYWVNKLSGVLHEATPLVGRTVTPRPQAVCLEQPFRLPEDVSEMMVKFTKGMPLSIYLVLVSALGILLRRYNGSQDVIIGSPVYKPDFEPAGMNGIIPLRCSVDDRLTFKDYLLHVKQTTLEAYSNQDCPFDEIAELLGVPSRNGWFPILNVIALLTNIHAAEIVAPITNDFTLSFSADGSSIGGRLRYNSALFDETEIVRLLDHFANILKQALKSPGSTISSIDLLTEGERQQIIFQLNDTGRPLPSHEAFPELFEAQCQRTPHRVAVSSGAQTLTYAELSARVNRLADRLREMQVGPEVIVGVLAERNTESVIAILAIMKAGGAYLPLDPAHPAARLVQLLSNSRCHLVLTARNYAASLAQALNEFASGDGLGVHSIDELFEPGEKTPADGPPLHPNQLAYVIYTSGSSGIPKGVMIEHRGMMNHLFAKIHDLDLSADDVVAQTASLCFDISVWQLFAAMLVGGRVHIVGDEAARDPQQLVRVLDEHSITVLETVPALLQVLSLDGSRAPAERRLSSLRWMIATGEALQPELVRQWQGEHSHLPLMNAYGPTECSDDVTHYKIAAPVSTDELHMPIGCPIANTQVYILDSAGMPLPAGIPGELFIGGMGVGRGYLDDPARTADVFLPDRFLGGEGRRLYKTGDVARYRLDGEVEFLGRLDHQVKVRGYRIELGEIEAVLTRHPNVQEAVVLVKEDQPGEKRLAAYIAATPGAVPSASELRKFLQATLAEYMVPAAFVFVDALPLTPNGKVDRKALSRLEVSASEDKLGYVAPRTANEKLLAEIWAKVLGVDRVGVYDNFFELGGDSILSIYIVAQAEQAGLRISPSQLFERPVIADLAAIGAREAGAVAERQIAAGPVPLTPIQYWFLEHEPDRAAPFNQYLTLELTRPLAPALLESAIQELALDHDALRLRFARDASGWRQFLSEQVAIPFERVDLSSLTEAEQQSRLNALRDDKQFALNLESGPTMSATLFHLGLPKHDRLLLIIHHLAVDMVSWRIILEDLWNNYQNLQKSNSTRPRVRSSSFKQWSERLAGFAASEEARDECEFWLADKYARAMRLPSDHAHQANSVASTETVSVSLSPEETAVLWQDVPRVYNAQVKEALLSAVVQSLSEWTDCPQVLIDIEGHGREDIFDDLHLSNLVGWLACIYPVVLSLDDAPCPDEKLWRVKEQLRQVPRRGIGYGVLRHLSPHDQMAKHLKNLPQAQVCLNYLGMIGQPDFGDAPFRLVREATGLFQDPERQRRYILEIDGLIAEDRLWVNWRYNKHLYRRETIVDLAESCQKALRELIESCRSPVSARYAPSDFPAAKLGHAELDLLMEEISQNEAD